MHQRLLGEGSVGVFVINSPVGQAQIEFMQRVTDNQTAILEAQVGKLFIELLYPVQKRFFSRRERLNVAVLSNAACTSSPIST